MKRLTFTILIFIFCCVGTSIAQIPVQWTELAGAKVVGDTLVKTSGSGWGNAGAISKNKLGNNTDGWVEYIAGPTPAIFAFGFSTRNRDDQFYSIEYAIQFTKSSMTFIRLKGARVHTFHYHNKDTLRIERNGTDILFKKNGKVIHTINNAPTSSLRIDIAIHSSEVKLGGFSTSFEIPAENKIKWSSLVGVEYANNALTKTAPGEYGSAGAISQNKLAANTDGWAEFKLDGLNRERAFGLSDKNEDNDYKSIDYGFMTYRSLVFVQKNGVNQYTLSPVKVGDVFRIERIGSVIYWMKNGVVVFHSENAFTGEMVVDAAIKTTGGKIADVKASF